MKKTQKTEKIPHVRYAYVPIIEEFRAHTKKNEARLWIPVETSLLVRYEFASCSLQTRYLFVAIVLYCGANGLEEIPLDARFMSSVLVADERTVEKSFEELLSRKLLQEREKREKRKEQTDRKEEKETRFAPVSVSDESLSKSEEENEEEKKEEAVQKINALTSQFSLDECKRYVEAEIRDGATIANANALAMKLFQTGQSDAFIKAKLYPDEFTREQFGEPVQFSDQPCRMCYGARQAEIKDGRYGKCLRCRNERGQPTGFEPSEKPDKSAKGERV